MLLKASRGLMRWTRAQIAVRPADANRNRLLLENALHKYKQSFKGGASSGRTRREFLSGFEKLFEEHFDCVVLSFWTLLLFADGSAGARDPRQNSSNARLMRNGPEP